MSDLVIYLSSYVGETEYRKIVNRDYGNIYNLLDPITSTTPEVMKKFKDKTLTRLDKDKIVRRDKEWLDVTDIMVVYMTRFTAGTLMEIMYAYDRDIKIFLIDPTGKFREDVWIGYHIDKSFDSIQECFDYIDD